MLNLLETASEKENKLPPSGALLQILAGLGLDQDQKQEAEMQSLGSSSPLPIVCVRSKLGVGMQKPVSSPGPPRWPAAA